MRGAGGRACMPSQFRHSQKRIARGRPMEYPPPLRTEKLSSDKNKQE